MATRLCNCIAVSILQFADSFKVEYHSGVSRYYKAAVYAARSEAVVETLADELMIAEAEFVIDDELFMSAAKLELKLTSQGELDSYTYIYVH